MKPSTSRLILLTGILGLPLALCLPLTAQAQSNKWQVNGFIGQGYISADGSEFIVGESGDTFDVTEAALHLSWMPDEHFRVAGAARYRQWGNLDESGLSADYLFAEYKFILDQGYVGARGGLFKSEAGFYTSTRDVSFTRPGILLPQSVYSDYLRDALLHITGGELFGGHPVLDGSLEWHLTLGDAQTSDDLTRNVVGSKEFGRFDADGYWGADLEYQDDSLRLGLTYFDAKSRYQSHLGGPFADGSLRSKHWIVSAQYRINFLEFTGEYLHWDRYVGGVFVPPELGIYEVRGYGYYLDVRGYLPGDVEVFVRYDHQVQDESDPDGDKLAERGLPGYFGYAHDWTIGTRWLPAKDWMVAAEYHKVRGAAWVTPILLPNPAVQDKDWSLFAIEISYKFQW